MRFSRILAKGWFVFTQCLTIPANIVITKLLRLTIERPIDLHTTRGTLFIANHQSKIDPFLITYHIGKRNLVNTMPIRYPVTHEYMQRPITGSIIRLLGGYNIGTTPLERLKKLVFTRELLKQGYSIVIFPEGKIVRDRDMVAEFQKGANTLFGDGYPVVFVRLIGLNRKHHFRFWKNKGIKLIYSRCYDATVTQEAKVQAMVNFFTNNEFSEATQADSTHPNP